MDTELNEIRSFLCIYSKLVHLDVYIEVENSIPKIFA